MFKDGRTMEIKADKFVFVSEHQAGFYVNANVLIGCVMLDTVRAIIVEQNNQSVT